MRILSRSRRRMIAKIFADLGKTIFAVGLASQFFANFSLRTKVVLWLTCFLFLAGSVLIEPRNDDKGG